MKKKVILIPSLHRTSRTFFNSVTKATFPASNSLKVLDYYRNGHANYLGSRIERLVEKLKNLAASIKKVNFPDLSEAKRNDNKKDAVISKTMKLKEISESQK